MIQRKVVYRAPRFDIEQVVEKLQDGQQIPRTIVRHPGAAVILPVLDDGRVCMIETYRVAIDRWHLELPAGTMDKGIAPIELAAIELQEETGYLADNLVLLHTFAMSPGILDEKMHLFLATGLKQGPSARELGEQMHNELLTWSQIDRLLRDGKIADAKTLVGLLWFLRYRQHA
ncbi:MAG: NUDIX hydrolase [Planctomycetota bacterium]|nr:NUDIX hydrolase [Planctomycetota bacterium]